MVKINLKNKFPLGVTAISNKFIDKFLPYANGEYVKIYIFLLRLTIDCSKDALTIAEISDLLECTSSDIIRALSYWEKQGLVNCSFNADGELTELSFIDLNTSSINYKSAVEDIKPNKPTPAKSKTISLSLEDKSRLSENNEVKEILGIAEQYLNKTLSSNDIETIMYIYDQLGFSVELIDYLIEYCVSKDKKSINYIKKVAFTWSDNQIKDVSAAKRFTDEYSSDYRKILNELGIKRDLGASEQEYINNWMNNYKMNIDMICEACKLALRNTNKPSFAYVDSVLKNWHENNITNIEMVNKLRAKHNSNKSNKKPSNIFNNFEQREYDDSFYDNLLYN